MTTDVERAGSPPALPVPSHVTQATAVEQARALGEVHAAVQVAQERPRDMARAIAEMRDSCSRLAFAERAFYAVPNRGSGRSVHMARELARIWGNMDHGVHELRRDDEAGMSEIRAFAWDLQANGRSTRTFQVPHQRMKKVGGRQTREDLFDLGDVYRNNQNIGARAVRECILAVLPAWFSDEAERLCRETLRKGEDGTLLPQRIDNMIAAFREVGVTVDQLERRIGRKRGQWSADDAAQMGIVFGSIQRGELRAEDEFPKRVTAAEITGAAANENSHQGATHREGSPDPARGGLSGGRRQPEEPVPVAPPNEEGDPGADTTAGRPDPSTAVEPDPAYDDKAWLAGKDRPKGDQL